MSQLRSVNLVKGPEKGLLPLRRPSPPAGSVLPAAARSYLPVRKPPASGLQRTTEREHLPAAQALGLGVVPWSPLAGGFLTGKYERAGQGTEPASGEGRLSGSNPFSGPFTKFTERNWGILDALRDVAGQLGQPLAQVALAWAAVQPGISAPIIGASRAAQVADNIAALAIRFSPEQLRQLAEASAPAPAFPYPIFDPPMRDAAVFGGASVRGWR